ncbi:hypothetical protein D3C71_1901630 [compost metagenome]
MKYSSPNAYTAVPSMIGATVLLIEITLFEFIESLVRPCLGSFSFPIISIPFLAGVKIFKKDLSSKRLYDNIGANRRQEFIGGRSNKLWIKV